MKHSQTIPVLLLSVGCNSILGITDHEVASQAGSGPGSGNAKNGGNAGQFNRSTSAANLNLGGHAQSTANTGQNLSTAGSGQSSASGGTAANGGSVPLTGGGADNSGGTAQEIGGQSGMGGVSTASVTSVSSGGSPQGGTSSSMVATGGAAKGGAASGGTAGGSAKGGATTGGAATGGTTTSTPPACTGATKRSCGGSCIDISTATAHCGGCDHDCGGGTCSAGVCQPTTIYTAPLPVTSVAVSTSEVIFATNDDVNYVARLLACPTSGCALAPRQLVTMKWDIGAIAWVPGSATASGTVVFLSAPSQNTIRPALYPCPDSGCPATPTSVASDGLGGFERKLQVVGNKVYYSSQHIQLNALTCSAGACTNGTTLGVGKERPFTANSTTMYFIDSSDTANGHSGYILSCDLSLAPPCTPATVLARSYSDSIDIQVVGNTLYWLSPGRQDFNEGRVHSCALPGCATVTDLALGLNSPTEMLIDNDGVYVIDAAGAIQRCVNTTCSGGIQSWIAGTAPHFLTSDASFLYWAEGNVVRRVAK
ncbi:MAG TPA: hypothetical protein VKP30_05915 [Polyangiaceae bacterium]|nr:hypothetical protein [Polyangiaceae bacterium]